MEFFDGYEADVPHVPYPTLNSNEDLFDKL